MSGISIFSLAIALFVLAATPGPGVFATISRSLASGFVPSLGVIGGFLPFFMDLSSLDRLDICMVAIIVAIVLSGVLIFYAYLANRARLFFSSERSVRRLNKTAGGIMIATGVAITVKS